MNVCVVIWWSTPDSGRATLGKVSNFEIPPMKGDHVELLPPGPDGDWSMPVTERHVFTVPRNWLTEEGAWDYHAEAHVQLGRYLMTEELLGRLVESGWRRIAQAPSG